jgi:hypothetical protein
MACLNLQGYTRSECDNSTGGIEKVVLFAKSALVDYSTSGGTVVELELGATDNAYVYEFQRDNANFTDAIIGAELNLAFQTTLNMTFRKTSKTILAQIAEMAKDYMVAVVKDNNGEYWLLSADRGLALIASAGASTGNIFEDPNNVIIALQGKERKPVQSIDISVDSLVDQKILTLFGF